VDDFALDQELNGGCDRPRQFDLFSNLLIAMEYRSPFGEAVVVAGMKYVVHAGITKRTIRLLRVIPLRVFFLTLTLARLAFLQMDSVRSVVFC